MPASRLTETYRTAFVTGASAGLGAAFCEMLLQEGVQVWGSSRDPVRLAPLAERHSRFVPVTLDLEQPEAAASVFSDAAGAAGGGFDLVILNAGFGVFGCFDDAEFAIWKKQIDAMLTTTARLSHAALRGFRSRGAGTLVHITSLAVEFPLPFMSGYNVAKAGLSALTESLIIESRGTGATVIDFRPGDYRTSFNQAMHPRSFATPPQGREARVWQRLEQTLSKSPDPARAAADLRRALIRGRSGVVRSGSFFQAWLAPRFARIAPDGVRRSLMARYFGAS